MTSSLSATDHPIIDDAEYIKLVGTHKPGSIVRIELKNFLTHGHAIIKPGPRLNIVVGANGTGKSTLLNAICLGLGGEPKLLGRADDLREFIMHEKDTAEIIIDLQHGTSSSNPGGDNNDGEHHTIRRIIDRNKGSDRGRGRGASTFFINNEQCKIEAVRTLVSNTYGISIDNLCTFLPQDKVGNFSSFTDQSRLLETEKTLSRNGYYYDIHQKLIQEEHEMEKSILDVDSTQDKLNKLMYEFDRLEREKALVEERERALAHIDLLKKKRIWLEFEEIRIKAQNLKVEKDNIKKQLKAANAMVKPLEDKLQSISEQKNNMVAKQRVFDQNTQRCAKEIEKQEIKFEKHDDEIDSLLAKLNEIDTRHQKLQEQLQSAQDRLKELQQSLASAPSKEETETEYKKSNELKRTIRTEMDNARKHDRAIRNNFKENEDKFKVLQSKLLKLNDDKLLRREKLFREKPNLCVMYEWIKKNSNRFRRPVCGPICLDLNFTTQTAASYVENHVSYQVLISFVVETKEDYDLLYESARKELKIPINVLLVRNSHKQDSEHDIKRNYSISKMNMLKEQHGIIGYLDETFTTSDTVMQALRDQSGVDRVLVGGSVTQHSIDTKDLLQLLSQPDPTMNQRGLLSSCMFVTKDNNETYRYGQSVSRYSKQLVAQIDQINSARMLGKGVDPEQVQAVQNEIDAIQQVLAQLRPELQQSEENVAQLQGKAQDINLQTESLQQKLDSYNKMEQKIIRQQSKVNEIQNELNVDENIEKINLANTLMNRITAAVSAMECHQQQRSNMIKYTISSAGVTINQTSLSAAERIARNELNDQKESFQELERTATDINNRFQVMKQKATQKKKEADEFAPIMDEDGQPLPLKEQIEELEQNEVVEIDAALEELERSIEGIHDNPDAIRQYDKLKGEIETLRETLDNVRGSRESKMSMLEKMKLPWESALDAHVYKINALFTTYMDEMGCTGEVRLRKGITSNNTNETGKGNFKEWGIEILVSFRQGNKAQILSAERHSGGERSVSTILYLMALQDLMVAPFRCVDEINQGLDDRNERLVFKRIVQNSCRKPKNDGTLTNHSGQYFLITPKLLPNLTDMEEHGVTILFVYNGAYNFKQPDELDFTSIAESSISLAKKDIRSNKKKVREDIESDNEHDKENGAANRSSRKNKKVR